jgi:hypothetical protein
VRMRMRKRVKVVNCLDANAGHNMHKSVQLLYVTHDVTSHSCGAWYWLLGYYTQESGINPGNKVALIVAWCVATQYHV